MPARRMYLGHLRLFLGIGLLFFPLGALITGIQYALFRLSGLSGLVDSAGSTNAVVDFLAIALGIVLTIFGLAVVQSATAIAMVDLDEGREARVLAAYRRTLSQLGPPDRRLAARPLGAVRTGGGARGRFRMEGAAAKLPARSG